MKIIFTKHSIIKLEHRKINRQFVLETIKNQEIIRQTYNFREELFKSYSKKNKGEYFGFNHALGCKT